MKEIEIYVEIGQNLEKLLDLMLTCCVSEDRVAMGEFVKEILIAAINKEK